LVSVGLVRSSRSSVPAGSRAVEQTTVAPATSVLSSTNAKPPIQKNGDGANKMSSPVYRRISFRLAMWRMSGPWQ